MALRGKQLGACRSATRLHFIRSTGIARIYKKSYRALELSKNKNIGYPIGGAPEIYCDDVLQFSASFRRFSESESDLFREIQTFAAQIPNHIGGRYPWYRLRHQQSRQMKNAAITPKDLAGIAKSIFRHLRKYRVGHLNWSNRTLCRYGGPWRGV